MLETLLINAAIFSFLKIRLLWLWLCAKKYSITFTIHAAQTSDQLNDQLKAKVVVGVGQKPKVNALAGEVFKFLGRAGSNN